MVLSFPSRPMRFNATFASVVVFLAIVALTGGTSRADFFSQALVRLAATLFAAAWLTFVRRTGDVRLKPALAFVGACGGLICLQLVPLPPGWWRTLPAHDVYVAVAQAVGQTDRWRPLSVAPDLTWSALFALLTPAALLIGLRQLSSRRRAELLLPLVVLIFASAVLGLAQVAGGPDSALRWYGGGDPTATGFLANRNHQALLLACALPMLAALSSIPVARSSWRSGLPWLSLGAGAFLVLMLPTTGSRAGIALGGLAIVQAAAIAFPAVRTRLGTMRTRYRRRLLGGGAAALIGFVVIFVFMGRNVAFSRVNSLDPLSDLRVEALPSILKMTHAFFPFGSGVGTFDPVFRRFEPFGLLRLTYLNEAHDDLLQIVMEGGVLAVLLFVAFICWWLVATLRAWRSPTSLQALTARAGSSVVLLCLLASVVDYPLRTALMLSVFTLASAWMLTPVPASVVADAPE